MRSSYFTLNHRCTRVSGLDHKGHEGERWNLNSLPYSFLCDRTAPVHRERKRTLRDSVHAFQPLKLCKRELEQLFSRGLIGQKHDPDTVLNDEATLPARATFACSVRAPTSHANQRTVSNPRRTFRSGCAGH